MHQLRSTYLTLSRWLAVCSNKHISNVLLCRLIHTMLGVTWRLFNRHPVYHPLAVDHSIGQGEGKQNVWRQEYKRKLAKRITDNLTDTVSQLYAMLISVLSALSNEMTQMHPCKVHEITSSEVLWDQSYLRSRAQTPRKTWEKKPQLRATVSSLDRMLVSSFRYVLIDRRFVTTALS